MTKLDTVRQIAKSKGITGTINLSTKKDKKYMISRENGKKIHFGAKGMEDFLDHHDPIRRKNFHNRFRNNVGYNDKNSGLYYSSRLLW